MRFVLAGIAFLCSLVCFGVGAWQIVDANASNHVTVAGSTDSGATLIVLPSETLVDRAGAQDIVLNGDGPIVAVVGRQADVAGWVGDVVHDRAVVDAETGTLVFETAGGGDETAPSPLGSDLWYQEYEGEGSLEIDASLPPGFAVLIASTGEAPAPAQVSITWPLDGRAPWSGPLFVAGIVFLLVALGLLLWALLSMRRGVRPRRQGEGPVDLRPSTSPLAVGPATEVEAEARDDSRDGDKAPEAGAAIPLLGEPLPAGDPFADPAGVESAVDDPWVPPAGAWAAPSEPVGASAPIAPPLAAHPMTSNAPNATADGEVAPSTDDDLAALFVDDAAEAPADEPASEPELSSEPESSLEPPAFGIRAPRPETPAAEDDVDGNAVETPSEAEPGDDDSGDDDSGDDDSGDDDRPSTPPSPPKTPPATGGGDPQWKRPRGRDRSAAPKRSFRLAAVLLVGSLGLAGCSSTMWPESLGGAEENPTATPTSTVDEALLNEGAPMPAVSEEQLTRILTDVQAVVAEADAAGDAEALAARFTGAALQARTAAYQASAVDAALPGALPFPTGAVVYAVPQASDAWPRTVFAVVEMGDAADAGSAPGAVMLVQETARSAYKVASLTQLAANVQLPDASPLTIGAPGLDEVGPGLVAAPEDLAAAYGDLMLGGEASADLFATDGDAFLPQVGQEYRDQQLAAIDTTASRLEFSNGPSDDAPLGIGTLDGGAIVAVAVDEVETFSARTQLATLSVSGRAAALAGATDSPYGFERIYTDQLLFYVPAAETGGQVQFLGYSQMMTSARQLDQTEVTYDS